MSRFIKRVYVVYVLLIILVIRIIGRIIFLQYFYDVETTDYDIAFRQEEIEANRGSILARDGRALSTSVPYFQIRMDCVLPADDLFNSQIDNLAKELSRFFGDKSARAYKSEIIKARRNGRRYEALGNRLVDYSEMMEIKSFPIFNKGSLKGGIITQQKNRRIRPFGTLASRTIGFINSNGVGVGVEGSYDFYLKGITGKQTVRKMLGGEWVPVNLDDAIPPQDGFDIKTTIDVDIQEAAENALRDQLSLSDEFEGGTAIVMEVKTGAIRAIANMKKGRHGTFDESYNYAIGHATEPGSTFKLATLTALIEDGFVTLDTPVDAEDGDWKYSTATYHDVTRGGYGEITMKEAFEKSSNVAFAKMAVEHYTGKERRFVDRIMNMKITEKFNLDIMGEARAVIYEPGDDMWSKVSLPSMAIGYQSLLTPLHTLAFYNAIANNGTMMRPYFIEKVEKDGITKLEFKPRQVSGSICSSSTIEQLKSALRGVVEEGTGKIINDSRYPISGKTGTARIAFDGRYVDAAGNRKHQASFAGFFPSDKPEYSAIVVLYSVKTKGNFYGGSWAAPVFKNIADKIYAYSTGWNEPIKRPKVIPSENIPVLAGNIAETSQILSFLPVEKKQDNINTSTWTTKETTPKVTGMGLKDALYILENKGYSVKHSGRGVVVSQQIHQSTRGGKKIIEIKLEPDHETKCTYTRY